MHVTRADAFNLVISSLKETATKSLPERIKTIVVLACLAFVSIVALYLYCKRSNRCFKQKDPAETQNEVKKEENAAPIQNDEPAQLEESAAETSDHPPQETQDSEHATESVETVQVPQITPPPKEKVPEPPLEEPPSALDLSHSEPPFLTEGKYPEAELILQRYIDNVRRYASNLSADGNIAEAEAQLLKALKVCSNDVSCIVAYGELLLKKKECINAQAQFEKALTLNSKDPRALNGRAQSLLEQRKFEDAEKEFAAALLICPNDPQLLQSYISGLKIHGILLQTTHDLPKAEEKLLKAVQTKPDDISCLICYAEILKQRGKVSESLQPLEQALALDPKNPLTLRCYGKTLQTLKRDDEAEMRLKEAVAMDPDNILGLKAYGGILFARRKWDEAASVFEKALRDEDKDVFSINRYGEILHSLKKYAQAAEQYQRALDLKPENAAASLKGLGLAQAALMNYVDAKVNLEQSLAITPDDMICVKAYAEVLLRLQKPWDALSQFAKVLVKDPKDEFALRGRSDALRLMSATSQYIKI